MERVMFKSKIHRATITQADVNYEGSITLDQDLLEAAEMLPYEQVHIWNVTRGTRLTDLHADRRARLRRGLHQRRGRSPDASRRPRHHRHVRQHERGRGVGLGADASSSSTDRIASASSTGPKSLVHSVVPRRHVMPQRSARRLRWPFLIAVAALLLQPGDSSCARRANPQPGAARAPQSGGGGAWRARRAVASTGASVASDGVRR